MASGTLFVAELIQESSTTDKPINFKGPFTRGHIVGASASIQFATQITGHVDDIEPTFAFSAPGVRAQGWTAQHKEHRIPGITVAADTGEALEITMMLNSFPKTVAWRNDVAASGFEAIEPGMWDLPPGTDTSVCAAATDVETGPPMRFELAKDVVFNSPILLKPVVGAENVRIALSNAMDIFGDREFSPPVIEGSSVLSLWTCRLSGVPVDAATIIEAGEGQQVETLTVFVRPWPAFQLFRDRMIARVGHLIDESYYSLAE